jgi:hypothetical protein
VPETPGDFEFLFTDQPIRTSDHAWLRINDTYTRKARSAARYKVGDQVEIREPYLYDSWTLVESVFSDMTAATLGKV